MKIDLRNKIHNILKMTEFKIRILSITTDYKIELLLMKKYNANIDYQRQYTEYTFTTSEDKEEVRKELLRIFHDDWQKPIIEYN